LLNHTLALPNAQPGAVASLVVTLGFGLVLLAASGILAAQKTTHSTA